MNSVSYVACNNFEINIINKMHKKINEKLKYSFKYSLNNEIK